MGESVGGEVAPRWKSDVTLLVTNSPPFKISVLFTMTAYFPLPNSQHIPSPNESYIVNSYVSLSRQQDFE